MEAQDKPLVPRDDEDNEAQAKLVEQILAVCEQRYAAVTGTGPDQWDGELSEELVGLALRTVRLSEREPYPQELEGYLRDNRPRLEQLWERYGPEGLYPRGVYHLVELPAVLVLCERLDSDPFWLTALWGREQEGTALERLSDVWLYGTDGKSGK